MYILADIKRNYWKSIFKYKQRRLLKKFENKKFVFSNEKDFIFYKYICKMNILADIKGNCKNSWFIYEQRRLLKKKFLQKIRIFYLKDFIFYKYICKMYKL